MEQNHVSIGHSLYSTQKNLYGKISKTKNEEHDMNTEKRNIGVTGLRGILVLMTALGCHYSFLFGMIPASSELGKKIFDICYVLGLTAPNAFFVMSGYFMYHKYRPQIKGGLRFKNYLFPKIAKIYPLMFFSTMYLFILENLGKWKLGFYPLHGGGGELRFSIQALFSSLCGIQSGWFAEGDTMSVNGPSWFIAVLMLCYIVFFGVIKFCQSRKSEWICYALLLVIGTIFTVHPVPFPLLYETSARGFLFFFEGCVLHVVMDMAKQVKKTNWLRCTVLSLMALIIAILFLHGDFIVWQVAAWPCLTYLIFEFRPLDKFLSFAPFVWAGNRSMSLFLGNLPILTTFAWLNIWYEWNVDYGSWTIWILITFLNLTGGQLIYLTFEKWAPSVFQRAIRLMAKKKNQKKK